MSFRCCFWNWNFLSHLPATHQKWAPSNMPWHAWWRGTHTSDPANIKSRKMTIQQANMIIYPVIFEVGFQNRSSFRIWKSSKYFLKFGVWSVGLGDLSNIIPCIVQPTGFLFNAHLDSNQTQGSTSTPSSWMVVLALSASPRYRDHFAS